MSYTFPEYVDRLSPQERDRHIRQQRQERIQKTIEKPSTYEAPGQRTPSWLDWEREAWSDDDSNDSPNGGDRRRFADKVPDVQFTNSLPPLEDLVGEYDVIFYQHPRCTVIGIDARHRVIDGDMKCTLTTNPNDEHQSLDITIDMDTFGLHIYDLHRENDIRLRVQQNGDMAFLNMNCREYINVRWGKMKYQAQSSFGRYMPEYEFKPWMITTTRLEQQYAKSISCNTLEEARYLAQRYMVLDTERPIQWLCNHLNMPEDVSTHIRNFTGFPTFRMQAAPPHLLWLSNHTPLPPHISSLVQEYATFNPSPPVFIFEKGDLWLTFKIDDDYNENVMPTLVARRRSRKRNR